VHTPSSASGSWGAQALWQQLKAVLPGLEVQVLPQVDSTNTWLMERARRGAQGGPGGRRADDSAPMLLVAEHQTQGRGRAGRGWTAAPGSSLTFSLALMLAPADWSGLSLAVGLALADALDPAAATPDGRAPRIAVKWPNDLVLLDSAPGQPRAGRKLAGILIETVGTPAAGATPAPRMAVVGVGINVQPLQVQQASQGLACMQELQPGASAPQVLAQVALPLARALKRFEAEGLGPCLAGYARRDLLAGQVVSTTQPGLPQGVAEGVDTQGNLRLRVDGRVQLVQAGDVSVRAQGGAAPAQAGAA
jgi:BirA family biotin operon repressor/biotin-[acetyl-CoA-carboxylase] ligase